MRIGLCVAAASSIKRYSFVRASLAVWVVMVFPNQINKWVSIEDAYNNFRLMRNSLFYPLLNSNIIAQIHR